VECGLQMKIKLCICSKKSVIIVLVAIGIRSEVVYVMSMAWFLMHIQPLFPRKPANMWLTDHNVCNNRMYYVLSMTIYLLNTVNSTHTFRQKLAALFVKYPNVDKRAMGFPADWENEPLWMV
jgi:hypothetical protein